MKSILKPLWKILLVFTWLFCIQFVMIYFALYLVLGLFITLLMKLFEKLKWCNKKEHRFKTYLKNLFSIPKRYLLGLKEILFPPKPIANFNYKVNYHNHRHYY